MVLKLFFRSKPNLVHTSLIFAIVVLSILVVGSMTMSGVNAAPTITLNPTSGPPGTTVHVTGSGYTPNGSIPTQLWNGSSTYTFTADANGNLNTTEVVPNVDPGPYVFIVIDSTSQATTTTQFTVTQSTTSPTPTATSSASTSPSVPEIQPLLVILTMFTAVSAAAILTVRKRKTAKSA
jgi:hypothetical protein